MGRAHMFNPCVTAQAFACMSIHIRQRITGNDAGSSYQFVYSVPKYIDLCYQCSLT